VGILHASERERLSLAALNSIGNMSWPKIARLPRYSQIPMTSLYMWVKGKRPLSDEHKQRLGIPYERLAPACSSCGKVHAYDRACEMQVIIKEKPKPKNPKRIDRHPRYYAWIFEQLTKAKDWK